MMSRENPHFWQHRPEVWHPIRLEHPRLGLLGLLAISRRLLIWAMYSFLTLIAGAGLASG